MWTTRITAAAGLAIAAAAALAVLTWSDNGVSPAQAATVNFEVILNDLSLDPEKALRKFLLLYHATPIRPADARAFAPKLTFDLPDKLPGNFRLVNTYGLRFGSAPGLAGRYERGSELLVVICHPAVHAEDYGTHKDYPCLIGQHRGHKVSVGEWSLVHVTDPTTCHCVLSRLDEETGLPAILAAVAPAAEACDHRDQAHGHH